MIDDVYQVTISGVLQTQTIQNVLHYQVQADADYVAFGAGVIGFFNDLLGPNLQAITCAEYAFTNLRIQKIWPLPVLFPIDTPLLISGIAIGTSMPAEVSMVLTKQTILAGPRYRGRVYLAAQPFEEMNTLTGLFSPALLGNAAPACANLSANIPSIPAGGSLKPVIYHRVAHTTTALQNVVARNTPRCQRRRQIGRGI